jgi:hypothetical protein
MSKSVRRFALVALAVLALPLIAPGIASAQYREFSGKVDKISKKKLFVDNRMGDKVSFVRLDETKVEGTRETWEDIKKNDWVTVSWKMMDKPRKAYIIVVKPPKEDKAEDM